MFANTKHNQPETEIHSLERCDYLSVFELLNNCDNRDSRLDYSTWESLERLIPGYGLPPGGMPL